MRNSLIIFKREFASYFATPLALVFIVIFLALAGLFTFFLGGFYERGQADLAPFFNYHPWLYLFLMPALSMRLWAEERKSGTIELLMTLPIAPWQAVLGKYLAAWAVAALALLLTFPMWITVNYLGDPDNGAIVAAYLGSFFFAGGFLAVGTFTSSITRNQLIAFILATTICFLFVMSGMELVQNALRAWAPGIVSQAISSMSFLTHFEQITRGVLDLTTIVFFLSLIAFALFANAIAVEQKKAA
jgi:ABC-2 type transport system permease protein